MALLGMDPNQARKVLRDKGQLRPVLAALVVALVGSGRAEAQCQTDDETEDSEKQLVDADYLQSVYHFPRMVSKSNLRS